MGGCCSAPHQDPEAHVAPSVTTAGASAPRRQHRHRERTSLERQNTEARDQLLTGRGGKYSKRSCAHPSNDIIEAPDYKRHGGWIAAPPMTRKELEHQRVAFWETADTFGGRKEVWDTLRAAVNCNDVETSRTMITGAELRLLRDGDLIHGCYDTTGFFYKIPENCLSDPVNLLKDDTPANGLNGTTNVIEQFPEAQLLDMKVRLSHNSQVCYVMSQIIRHPLMLQDLIIKVAMVERVSSVATKIQAAAGVQRLKLMVLGKLMKSDGTQTLKEAGWNPGLIVQALVTVV